MAEEIFPIVDENGNVTGSATRTECHSGNMLLHPVVHLHIVTPERDSLLLQRRALTKKIQPGKWDTAVGGHVDLGENVAMALLRESREELGVDAAKAKFIEAYPFQSSVERELVHVHFMEMERDAEFHAAPDEVIDVRFWALDEIDAALGTGVFTPNFESEYLTIVKPALL